MAVEYSISRHTASVRSPSSNSSHLSQDFPPFPTHPAAVPRCSPFLTLRVSHSIPPANYRARDQMAQHAAPPGARSGRVNSRPWLQSIPAAVRDWWWVVSLLAVRRWGGVSGADFCTATAAREPRQSGSEGRRPPPAKTGPQPRQERRRHWSSGGDVTAERGIDWRLAGCQVSAGDIPTEGPCRQWRRRRRGAARRPHERPACGAGRRAGAHSGPDRGEL